MIPAVVIIIALALAFIILIRRLPKTTDLLSDQTTPVKPEPTTPPVQLPTLTLPKVSLPDLSQVKLPKVTLPKFSLPTLPKRSTAPASTTPNDTPNNEDPLVSDQNKDEFWQELEEVKQGAKKPVEVAAPTISKPITPVPTPAPLPTPPIAAPTLTKNKGRDVFQEAEDAFAIKDYRKAERLYLKLATEDPRNAKVYGRLGVIYLEQKNYDDARDALQVAIKLEPNIASRHFNLALTYLELGSHAKAIAAMESALKYDPSNRKYRKMLDEIINNR